MTFTPTSRDFESSPQQTTDAAGNLVTVGYRLSGGRMDLGAATTRPVYLDDQRIAVCTPSGMLLCANTTSGQTERLHDFQSPINALAICQRLLLVGGEDGKLNMLST